MDDVLCVSAHARLAPAGGAFTVTTTTSGMTELLRRCRPHCVMLQVLRVGGVRPVRGSGAGPRGIGSTVVGRVVHIGDAVVSPSAFGRSDEEFRAAPSKSLQLGLLAAAVLPMEAEAEATTAASVVEVDASYVAVLMSDADESTLTAIAAGADVLADAALALMLTHPESLEKRRAVDRRSLLIVSDVSCVAATVARLATRVFGIRCAVIAPSSRPSDGGVSHGKPEDDAFRNYEALPDVAVEGHFDAMLAIQGCDGDTFACDTATLAMKEGRVLPGASVTWMPAVIPSEARNAPDTAALATAAARNAVAIRVLVRDSFMSHPCTAQRWRVAHAVAVAFIERAVKSSEGIPAALTIPWSSALSTSDDRRRADVAASLRMAAEDMLSLPRTLRIVGTAVIIVSQPS